MMQNKIEQINENISNSTINNYANIIIGKSYEYNDLLDQLKTQQEIFDLLPEDKQERRLEISAKINELDNRIKQFKEDVLRLAEQFNRIEINTDRLRRAKEHFDKGEIGEARAVLESELEQMTNEQNLLLKSKDHYYRIKDIYEKDTVVKLKNNAEEFLTLALTSSFNYKNPAHFKTTCSYFESSIKSYKTQYNLFLYAHFLSSYHFFQKAFINWNECLQLFENQMSTKEKIEIYNNLATSLLHLENADESIKLFEKSLILMRQQYKSKPTNQNLFDLGYVLNNFGLLLTNIGENEKAESLLLESHQIREKLVKLNKKQDFVNINNLAVTNLNLGLLYRNKIEYEKSAKHYLEAKKLFETIRNYDDFNISLELALINNNLGDLCEKTNEFNCALDFYDEGITIMFKLFGINTLKSLPNTIRLLSNLSSFHQIHIINKDKSIDLGILTIILGLPKLNDMEFLLEDLLKAREVLHNWNLSDEEIEELIQEAKSDEL